MEKVNSKGIKYFGQHPSGQLAIIFLWISCNFFYVAWQGNFVNPGHIRLFIAHAIWDGILISVNPSCRSFDPAPGPVKTAAYFSVYQWWYSIRFTHEQRSLDFSSFCTPAISFITGRLAPSTTPMETKCFMLSSC